MRLLMFGVLTATLFVPPACPMTEPAAAGVSPPPQEAVGSASWPQFRGDPRLTGVANISLPEKLTLAWTYEAGESIESSAAIVEGTVYVGTQAGDLLALELATGKLRWKYRAGSPIGESSPAVSDGVVFVGDLQGALHAVQASTGKGLWKFEAEGEVKSSPVVVDGRVIFGSYDGHLYAVAARTGKLLWKLLTDGPVHSTASVAGGLAYIAGCDGFLRAVRISDGQEEFRVEAGAYTGASPPLVDGWTFFGTFNNEVLGVDLSARRIAWRYQHPTRHFPFYSSAAVTEGKVIVGGRDKLVHALEAKTGKEIWSFATRARVESSPGVAGGRVYVGSNDGRFYVLDLESGEKLWEFEAGAPLSASPAIAAGRVVIGDQDGRLYCFR